MRDPPRLTPTGHAISGISNHASHLLGLLLSLLMMLLLSLQLLLLSLLMLLLGLLLLLSLQLLLLSLQLMGLLHLLLLGTCTALCRPQLLVVV